MAGVLMGTSLDDPGMPFAPFIGSTLAEPGRLMRFPSGVEFLMVAKDAVRRANVLHRWQAPTEAERDAAVNQLIGRYVDDAITMAEFERRVTIVLRARRRWRMADAIWK